jgi:UDP-3-O-[3-hydroxymyristoyl] glucosamine N-acyltransferase
MAVAAPAVENAAARRTANLLRMNLRPLKDEEKQIMTRTANELAEFLQCTVEGDGGVQLSGVAAPDSASTLDLIYVENQRHLDRAAVSEARCVVIAPGLALHGKTLLRAANPKLAFARAAAWLVPPAPVATGIHPTAVISPTAQLARGVAVGPFAVIEENVKVGEGTEIGAFCFLGRNARIGGECRLFPRVTLYAGAWLGERVILHSGAVIGSDGFGYVAEGGKRWKFPQVGQITIEHDVEIGANTTIDRGSLDRTEISAGVKIDNLVHIAHNVHVGENTVIAAQTGISGSATIGRDVAFGGQAGLGERCRIEDGAVVGGQAGILPGKTIRAGQVVWGTPARALEKFKDQFAWSGRLPELAERIGRLEKKAGKGKR